MEKLRFFLAAAFMAALTGCPTPNPMPDSDTGTPAVDSGPDVDSGTDLVDAGIDAYVPPGEDGGIDSGTIPNVCEDVDYVGIECNLPFGMEYTRSEFICGVAINNDLWITDEFGAVPHREFSREESGVIYAQLSFAFRNGGMVMPSGPTMEFTCGPQGRCWLNWFNPDSSYSHCSVTFNSDCSTATTECWAPGSTTPVASIATYVGE